MRGNIYIIIILLISVWNASAQNTMGLLDERIKLSSPAIAPAWNANAVAIDTTLSKKIYDKNYRRLRAKLNIYEMPYSVTKSYPNYKGLGINTAVLTGMGVLTLGVLYAMPEGATSWNKKEIMDAPPFKRWWENVKRGPVWDNDNFVFNYILHPYGGAVYYMTARSHGFNLFQSFLYTTAVSTLLWEYGFEAFMEVPSIQDLIVTPTTGVLLGEAFYVLKRHIVSNDYRLFGSRFLGNVVSYIIDPVNEVVGIFAGNPNRQKLKAKRKNTSIAFAPQFSMRDNKLISGFSLGVSF